MDKVIFQTTLSSLSCLLFGRSKRSTENVNTWEHYHNVIRPLSTSSAGSSGSPLADSTIIRIEAHGDLQLHPNYGAACQVSHHYYYLNFLFRFDGYNVITFA